MTRFPYTVVGAELDSKMPYLELTLSYGDHSLKVKGVVDSGAEINILPYDIGHELGAIWEQQPKSLSITQGFESIESRSLVVHATHPQLTNEIGPVPMLFAWARSKQIQLIFGQTNFLMEFNVCFYRSQNFFEVWRS